VSVNFTAWKKATLINVSGLIGIADSLFLVPPQTPFWLWAVLAGVALALLNVLCFGRRRTATASLNQRRR